MNLEWQYKTGRPLIVTFRELAAALFPFHLNERAHLATLHDVWLKGAPTPGSRILNPKGYDERAWQPGNIVKRIVPAPWLAQWIQDMSAVRGMPLDWRQCMAMVEGQPDYGLDLLNKPIMAGPFTRSK